MKKPRNSVDLSPIYKIRCRKN